MTSAAEAASRRTGTAGSRAIAILLVAGAASILLSSTAVRELESSLLGVLATACGVPATANGTVVHFPADSRSFTGLEISIGCSVGPLLAFFILCCAAVMWFRPPSLARLGIALGSLIAGFVVVNQLRLLLIVFSIRTLGVGTGYELSHVFLGSVVTIAGFCAALYLCFRLLIARPRGTGR